jgi:hypothetical protein
MLKLRKGIDIPIIPEDFIILKREPPPHRRKTAGPAKPVAFRRPGSGNPDVPSGEKKR